MWIWLVKSVVWIYEIKSGVDSVVGNIDMLLHMCIGLLYVIVDVCIN